MVGPGCIPGERVPAINEENTKQVEIPTKRPLLATVLAVAVVLICTVGAAVAIAMAIKQPLIGIDDANIFFAYARNLTQGHGLVYYPGGERVEGFTSPAWMIICSVAMLLSKHYEILLLGLNILLVTLTLVKVLSFVRTDIWPDDPSGSIHRPTVWFEAALLCWTFFSPSYVCWTLFSLMESAWWGLVLTFGTITAARGVWPGTRGWGLAAWVALALVTRPEAMLIALVWIAGRFLAMGYLSSHRWRLALYCSLAPLIVYAITTTSLIGFRLFYFGYPLANTFYAKVSPDFRYNLVNGLIYLLTFVNSQMLILVSLGVGLVFILEFLSRLFTLGRRDTSSTIPSGEDMLRGGLFVFVLSLFAATAGPVVAGGDHFALFRFFQPFWPLFAVPLLAWIASFYRSFYSLFRQIPETSSHGVWAWAVVSCTLLVTFYAMYSPPWHQVFLPNHRITNFGRYDFTWYKWEIVLAKKGRQLGQTLNQIMQDKPHPSVGIITAGGVAVTYQGPIVDLMGLNNVRMGHSPGERKGRKNHSAFNIDVFFELSPDLVLPKLVDNALEGAKGPKMSGSDNEMLPGLLESPRFQKQYVGAFFPLSGDTDSEGIVCWCSSEALARLRASGVTVRLPETGMNKTNP